ncbi:MAG TPA: hypothetical protein VKZ53_05260 [Candidatus Angelobacter sp.]|nr:hypothetical protein [Candidatus Angelobacter sp.]
MCKRNGIWLVAMTMVLLGTMSAADGKQLVTQTKKSFLSCPNNTGFCADINHTYQEAVGHYTGHDEPAILFYSDKPGSGNNFTTTLTLPLDPPTPPKQDGTGGTFNFQLHSAIWFGMILCDTQSAPNFTNVCIPNTDANIFEDASPSSAHFIGHHPGSAFLELQFYPPGGMNTCSDPTLWCVAMTIDSFNMQDLTGQANNADCQTKVGLEPINFAMLTTTGVSQSPADPLNLDFAAQTTIIPGTTFQMRPGDQVKVIIHDTKDGLKAIVKDLTAGTEGSMTASIANGFTQVNFVPDPDPNNPSVTCSSTPYAFHPMYSTSSEQTRSTWLAHAINVSFSDEIGHFEYCDAVDFEGGSCIAPSVDDPGGTDIDDFFGNCFSGDFLATLGLQPVGGCSGDDLDFDSVSYKFNWPGTGDAATDRRLKTKPIRFTDPRFHIEDDQSDGTHHRGPLQSFSRVAFETNMPTNEFFSNPDCSSFSGINCANPPTGALFYPIYSTFRGHHNEDGDGTCQWQLGGANIPGTDNNFGGTSTAEYGPPLKSLVITAATSFQPNGGAFNLVSNFRQVLPNNPCAQDEDQNHNDGDGQ